MRAVAAITLLALTSCGAENAKVCEPLASERNTLHNCVHRAAYQFAQAQGTNAELAKATVAKCQAYVTQAAELRLRDALEEVANRGIKATNEHYLEARESFLAEANSETSEMALMRIVEARAGSCDPID